MEQSSRDRRRRVEDDGQILPLFAISLVAILGLMGLGLDAAQAFLERRDAQGAADLASLAGARYLPSDPSTAISEAKAVGALNGYQPDDVLVTTPYKGDASKIQVIIQSNVSLFFMPVLGLDALDVNADAAAVAAGAAASCSFCSLNDSDKNHTLLLKNGATLRVDGDIIVNSVNGGTGPDCQIKDWEVCGDGFDIFGDPPDPPAYISAKSITVAGGWETHDENVVMADDPIWPDYSTNPPTYKSCPSISPNPNLQPPSQAANVCIHAPQITDPLNDPAFPQAMLPTPSTDSFTVPDDTSCPDGTRFPSSSPSNTSPLVIASTATICPGVYYGGLKITSGTTTMLPGFYYMAGKNGFTVTGTANVDGSAGVTIYSSARVGGTSLNILPDPDLAKPLDPNRLDPIVSITSDHNPVVTGSSVKYTFTIEPATDGPAYSGTVDFYDGAKKITDDLKCKAKVFSGETKKKNVTCQKTYNSSDTGNHGIAAVFVSSDTCSDATCYNNAEAILDPVQVVTSTTDTAGDIDIETNGQVLLSASRSGAYRGLVFYQDRTSDGAITLSYGSGLAACSPSTLVTVDGVTGPEWALEQPPGAPCGALGGIEGTIYAPNTNSLVTTTVSGLANVQVIAGKMLIDSTATTRFAFDGDLFAGNKIALIE